MKFPARMLARMFEDSESRTTPRRLATIAIAGALVVLATAGAMYGSAAGGASMLGESFNTTESSAHARSLEFSTEATRASAEHDADRVACARQSKDRRSCNAAAKDRNARGF